VAATSLPLDPITHLVRPTDLAAQATRRPIPHTALAPTAVVIHLVVAAAIHLFQVVVVTTHQAAATTHQTAATTHPAVVTTHQPPAGEEATHLAAQATRRPIPHTGLAPTAAVIHLSQVVAAAIHRFQVVVVTTHRAAVTTHQTAVTTHQREVTTHQREVTTHQREVTTHQREVTTHQAAVTTHQTPAGEEATHLDRLLRLHLRAAIIHQFRAEEAAQPPRL